MTRIIKEAFYIARSGRPGPVLVDIPKDVSAELAEFKYPEKVSVRGYQPTYAGHPGQIKEGDEADRFIEETACSTRGEASSRRTPRRS